VSFDEAREGGRPKEIQLARGSAANLSGRDPIRAGSPHDQRLTAGSPADALGRDLRTIAYALVHNLLIRR
jgi:hypothetical protein